VVDNEDYSSEEEDVENAGCADNDDVNASPIFFPGQFACPVVFKRSFPLHWRIRPQHVLNTVLTSLTPMASKFFMFRCDFALNSLFKLATE
jgi:hypothetical protein